MLSLFERRVDGLIVAPAEGDHGFLENDLSSDFPVVAINRTATTAPLWRGAERE